MPCNIKTCSGRPVVLQVNIMGAVRWLLRDTQAQDSLVFAFSGHGCFNDSREQERDGIMSSDYERVHPVRLTTQAALEAPLIMTVLRADARRAQQSDRLLISLAMAGFRPLCRHAALGRAPDLIVRDRL